MFFVNSSGNFVHGAVPAKLEERADIKMLLKDVDMMRFRDPLLRTILKNHNGISIDTLVRGMLDQQEMEEQLYEYYAQPGLLCHDNGKPQNLNCCSYLLIDPRDFANSAENIDNRTVSFYQFVRSIFYIGHGMMEKCPMDHLRTAKENRRPGNRFESSLKRDRIGSIWDDGFGVFVFRGQEIPKDRARTQEACMLMARLTFGWSEVQPFIANSDLANKKKENYAICPVSKRWNEEEAEHFGVYLLLRAYKLFVASRVRPYLEADIRDSKKRKKEDDFEGEEEDDSLFGQNGGRRARGRYLRRIKRIGGIIEKNIPDPNLQWFI